MSATAVYRICQKPHGLGVNPLQHSIKELTNHNMANCMRLIPKSWTSELELHSSNRFANLGLLLPRIWACDMCGNGCKCISLWVAQRQCCTWPLIVDAPMTSFLSFASRCNLSITLPLHLSPVSSSSSLHHLMHMYVCAYGRTCLGRSCG